jgi:NADPH-dependent 2,4-dienoyl-CoA reductase/sulfur reductase-like enzyme/peroxiredoxin family protein/TusA-related sulfurtransferase/rhodanese-related sulfurtransferase
MAKYLIVGGVAGGAGVAARLRRLDETAEITVFERGDYVSYANCGLPYYAGGVITDRGRLFIMTPEKFKAALNVNVLTAHEAVSIDRKGKSLRVRSLKSGNEFDAPYDFLILSPGASPMRPPIPGIDNPAILSLRSVADVDAIKARLDSGRISSAVVVGGGFIGLEMAENLAERGAAVTVVEALDQVMNVIDYEMAAIVQDHMRRKGVALRLKDGVSSFEPRSNGISVRLSSGAEIQAELVILSIGVRPDTQLARAAGLELAANGAIKVDGFFATSDPSIRAVGDAIEFMSPILGVPLTIPLAGPANKQARLCADALVQKRPKPYKGSIGTSIAKVFDLAVGTTGASEKALAKAGIPYAVAATHAGSHAGYYPGSLQLSLKLLYSPESGRILGAQCVGADGVDKRIDVVAAFIQRQGTVSDLAEFEHAYAPPFSSAKDPLNMLGFIAQNAMEGRSRLVTWREVDAWKERKAFFLDVRSAQEFELGSLPGAVNIPHTEIRSRLAEIPRDRPILVNCAIGLRGYLAERVLRLNGYADVGNLTGGYRTWSAVVSELALAASANATPPAVPGAVADSRPAPGGSAARSEEDGSPGAVPGILDARGLQCPGPIIQLKRGIDALKGGQRLMVLATDPGFARDVKSWCSLTGNTLVSLEQGKGDIKALVEKGDVGLCGGAPCPAPGAPAAQGLAGATFIVFSNDMDKALASFVLANGAAATGRVVTMFFTFWGLSVIRDPRAGRVKKDFMGKMFGIMLPKGTKKLSLSKMNMGGMGSAMMKGRMKAKNVDQLDVMLAQARASGVRMIACQMSMDIMGVKAEELVAGVEIGGVATYIEAAAASGVNLFI